MGSTTRTQNELQKVQDWKIEVIFVHIENLQDSRAAILALGNFRYVNATSHFAVSFQNGISTQSFHSKME